MERRVANGSTSSLVSLSSTASAEGDSVFVAPAPAGFTGSEHFSDALAIQRKQSLERKLLCRRSVTELVEQGIYPPLKSPAAFHEQAKHLERAKAGDILKHKIEHRPDRQLLVAQNILDDCGARSTLDPAIQARQRQLKKASLLTDLNDRLSRRPGPFDLVQTNILEPVEGVRERLQATFTFGDAENDEDDPSARRDDTLIVSASQDGVALTTAAPSAGSNVPSQSYSTSSSISPTASVSSSLTITSQSSGPASVPRASQVDIIGKKTSSRSKLSGSLNNSLGAVRAQPRQKGNLKFHIYTAPPAKRTERVKTNSGSAASATPTESCSPTHSNASTASQANCNFQRILEQQTVLLQLQNEAERLDAAEEQRRLLERLEDMKVNELRVELRKRGLRMHGTKNELTDRLRSVLKGAAASGPVANCHADSPSLAQKEPNANLEALMQQLQQEIQHEQVQTRRLAAPQAPCYLLNSSQPVILVNLPNVTSQSQSPVQDPLGNNKLPVQTFSTQSSNVQARNSQMQRSFSAQPACGVRLPQETFTAHQLSVPNDLRTFRSEVVDDVLDILIRSGELSPSAARTPKDALSSPSTVNIINSIGRRDAAHEMASDFGARATGASCHFRFTLPPIANENNCSMNGEAMEYTPAPSPLPNLPLNDCMFSHSASHNAFSAEEPVEFNQMLNLMPLNGLSQNDNSNVGNMVNLNGSFNGAMDKNTAVQSQALPWSRAEEHYMLPNVQLNAQSEWFSGAGNSEIDLNSLMYSQVYVPPVNESTASPQSSVCDSLQCNR